MWQIRCSLIRLNLYNLNECSVHDIIEFLNELNYLINLISSKNREEIPGHYLSILNVFCLKGYILIQSGKYDLDKQKYKNIIDFYKSIFV